MKIEFLGTGGAITIPRPCCKCRVCNQARKFGIPYSRMGPSLYIHEAGILFDTPEEIKVQLNRSGIDEIKACFYSHWHPDHVMGRRVWETVNKDWRGFPPKHKCTDVYVPQQVAEDFRKRLSTWEHLSLFDRWGVIHLIELEDERAVKIEDIKVTPFRLALDYVYAFLLEEKDKKVLVIMDEHKGWRPSLDLQNLDLVILPMGVIEYNPLTGERQVPEGHPVLSTEAKFEETIDIVKQLKAKKVVITHIEETDRVSYDDLLILQRKLQYEDVNITFAYDSMYIEV